MERLKLKVSEWWNIIIYVLQGEKHIKFKLRTQLLLSCSYLGVNVCWMLKVFWINDSGLVLSFFLLVLDFHFHLMFPSLLCIQSKKCLDNTIYTSSLLCLYRLTSRTPLARTRLLSCIETGNDDPVFTVYGTDQAIISSKGLLRNGALEHTAPGIVKLRMPLTSAYSFLFVIYKEEIF